MKAVLATDLSAASEATIENETCLDCLGRIGIEEMHLVRVIPSNVHAGTPGINFEKRRRKAIRASERVVEDAVDPTTILVGSRGHSRLRRLLLGSVSEDLVARARQRDARPTGLTVRRSRS